MQQKILQCHINHPINKAIWKFKCSKYIQCSMYINKTQLPIGNAFILTSTQKAAKYNTMPRIKRHYAEIIFSLSPPGMSDKTLSDPTKSRRMKTALETSKGLRLMPENRENNVVTGSVNTWIFEVKRGSNPQSRFGTRLLPWHRLTRDRKSVV